MADSKYASLDELPSPEEISKGSQYANLDELPAPPKSKLDSALETAKDTGYGALHGATFGFEDELGAGAKVIADLLQKGGNKLTNGLIPKSDTQENEDSGKGPVTEKGLFRETQKSLQDKYKEAQKRSPIATTVGDVGGSIASAIPASGLTATGLAAGSLKAALAEGGITGLAKLLAKKAGVGALEAAPLGALEGAGRSDDGNLIGSTDQEKMNLVKDAGSGALIASPLAAAGTVAGELAPLAKSKLGESLANSDNSTIRKLKKLYDIGAEGKSLNSTADKVNDLAGRSGKSAEDFVNKVGSADEYLGQKVGQTIQDATDNGVSVPISEVKQGTAQELVDYFGNNPDLARNSKITKLLGKALSGENNLNPTEALQLRDELYKIKDLMGKDTTPLGRKMGQVVGDYAGDVNNSIKETIPEYKDAAAKFKGFREQVPESLTDKNPFDNQWTGDLKNPQSKLYESTKDTLENAMSSGGSSLDSASKFGKLINNIKNLGSTLGDDTSEVLKRLGGSSDDIAKSLQGSADESAALGDVYGKYSKAEFGASPKKVAASFLPKTAGQVANYSGQADQLISNLANAPTQKLTQISQTLKNHNNQSIQAVGRSLENAIANKNAIGRNAAIFSIMQNPQAREAIRGHFMDSNGDNQSE